MSKYYLVKVKVLFQDVSSRGDKVKFKTSNEEYLVKSENISHAQSIIKSFIMGIYDSFEIIEIKQSRIVAVVQDVKDTIKG